MSLPLEKYLNFDSLVTAGWAWWFRKYAPDDKQLAKAEAEARKAKRSLWADPSPIPLWEWRQRQKDKHNVLDVTVGNASVLPNGNRVIQRFRLEYHNLLEQDYSVTVALRKSFVRCPPTGLGIDSEPFWMGTAEGEKGSYPNEHPRHQVVISPFYLQSTPVTRRHYRLYDENHEMAYAASFFSENVFAEYAPSDDCPMIKVSWYDAWVFAHWIGGRLPTEAEWEYACRAGTRTPWSCGKEEGDLDRVAWYNGNSAQPVGQKQPNSWGLYDMHGNVQEWCWDWFDEDYYKMSSRDDPRGPLQATHRVVRGGGWFVSPRVCRSAYRGREEPAHRAGGLGFRVAAVPPGK